MNTLGTGQGTPCTPLEQVMTIPVSEYIDLRARADRYEANADERGRALEDLRRMTMAIEPVESGEARKKRRWWQRDPLKTR